MGNTVVALQGKNFVIELVSNLGSTNYRWCVTKMPEGIWLVDTDVIPVNPGLAGGKTIQQFVFIAAQVPEEQPANIKFKLACMSDVNKESREYEAEVTVIPSNSEDFVKYSESIGDIIDIHLPKDPVVAYGVRLFDDKILNDYGDLCDANDATVKYGYACGADGGKMMYGYPCGVNDAAMKYGYPCGANDAAMKYGYPCGVNDAAMKYGYPCGANDAAMKYGYPCSVNDAAMKYGYPCGVNDATVKYGYPCSVNDAAMKYGYPCGVNDAAMKYGYPCGVNDAAMKYGYPCAAQTE